MEKRIMNQKKVLVISHLAFNDSNNVGKTLYSLFYDYDKENIIQLFFNPLSPNVDKCQSSYLITDDEMIKSLHGAKAGSVYTYYESDGITTKNSYVSKNRKTTYSLLLRDILWKVGRVDYSKLFEWLRSNNPDVIFLAPGYSAFLYRIALKISKRLNIPIVTFLMDDFYNEKKNNSFIERIRSLWIKKSIRKTINSSSKVFACSQEMADDYGKMLDKHIDVLYTPILDVEQGLKKWTPTIVNNYIFAGNLNLNRHEVLYKIGSYLGEKYPDARLYVYTTLEYKNALEVLSTLKNVVYGGFVSAEVLKQKISESDVVLHVESFDEVSSQMTRYSVSTKVPECMMSGKIFFAVGPKYQAGIKYLKDNKCAIVSTSFEEMFANLDLIQSSDFNYQDIYENAIKMVKTNHSCASCFKRLQSAFDSVCIGN